MATHFTGSTDFPIFLNESNQTWITEAGAYVTGGTTVLSAFDF